MRIRPLLLCAMVLLPMTAAAQTGRISGVVRHAASMTPLPDVWVHIYDSTGVLVSFTITDASGAYASNADLATGTYYAHTENNAGYIDEIFDSVPCPGTCYGEIAALHGTPIPVISGQTTARRNFLLDRGGQIKGRVSDSAGAGVQGVALRAFDGLGFESGIVQTTATGEYTISGLGPGSYYLMTLNAGTRGLVNEIYNNLPCPLSCSDATAEVSGARVTVALEGAVSNVDFILAAGGAIGGTVTDAATGAPLQDVGVRVIHSTATGFTTASATTDASGMYTVAGLPAGTYQAITRNEIGFIDEVFGNVVCPGSCETLEATLGTPIAVAVGAVTGGIDFALDRGGRISGRVVDAATGALLQDVLLEIHDAQGRRRDLVETDASGAYLTRRGLASGTYYASIFDAPGHLRELYDNLPCHGECDQDPAAFASATPIPVAAGATTTGKDFALDPGGRVSGVVTDEATGVRLSSMFVRFYDSAGRYATSAFVSQGDYMTTTGLAAGTYYAFTSHGSAHVNELYGGLACPAGCTPSQASSGAPIAVGAGGVTSGINFALARRTGVPGAPLNVRARTSALGLVIEWTAPAGGGVASSYQLEAGLAPGATAVTLPTTDTQYFVAAVPPGVYYLRVKGVNAAGIGPASTELTLTIGPGGAPPGAPFVHAVMSGARLLMSWSEGVSGGTPDVYLVEAGTATGLANIATISTALPTFTYDPVPNGFYFLRVRARNASGTSAPSNEVMIVAGGVPSPPPAPGGFATTVSQSTVTLNWLAPPGPVTGYVLEAGSAPGLSNLAVVPLAPATSATFQGIPPGTYFVRIRAVNVLGRSVASDEIVVVVG